MIDKKRAKSFCREDISLIENYDKAIADTTQTWHCHHRRETIFSRKDLKEIGEYYNRPACELIFLNPTDHCRLHNLGKPSGMNGKHHSAEARKKMSEAHKGKPSCMKGKHHTAETRKNISEANKGKHHTAETRKKISEANKGKCRSVETRKKISEAKKNMSDETKRKISAALLGNTAVSGTYWYNNGKINTRSKKCPEGFVKGRIKK